MKLVSIPANPVPENAVTGMIRTPDGVGLRFARFPPPANRRGTVCLFPGRTEWIEKYFETVRDLREIVLPDCPPPLFAMGHSMGATVLIRAAYRGQRWFDRIVLLAPMISLAGVSSVGTAGNAVRVMRLAGFGKMYVPRRYRGVMDMRPFAGNILTTDPVRYARNKAILEAEPELGLGGPTVAWCDAAFRAMGTIRERSYAARIRQPLLVVAAGREAIVSNKAIEEFAMHLRAGSHLMVVGAQHEILMEQDRFRSQLWAAFDAFVPGTPLFA